jgi:hypothetical protein
MALKLKFISFGRYGMLDRGHQRTFDGYGVSRVAMSASSPLC